MRLLWAFALCFPMDAWADAPVPLGPEFLLRGATVEATYLGSPGDRIGLAASVNESGRRFCPSGLGGACSELRGPSARWVGREPVSGDGFARFPLTLPPVFSPTGVWLQAVATASGAAPAWGDPVWVPIYDAGGDEDGDGLANVDELAWGTSIGSSDHDGDGLTDGQEVWSYGTSPTSWDTDGGGVSDSEEVLWQSTDPHNPGDDIYNPDSDGDGLWDNDEIWVWGTSPYAWDTDGDTLGDGDEVSWFGTSPTSWDTDGGGVSDGEEVLWQSTDPHNPGDDIYNPDSDGDGLWDNDELWVWGTSPYAWDTDGGGAGDAEEVGRGSNPNDASDDVPPETP
jgi:hypothetical protein